MDPHLNCVKKAIEGSKYVLNTLIDNNDGNLCDKETLELSMELDELINTFMKMTDSD
jgi:hypothetical protein